MGNYQPATRTTSPSTSGWGVTQKGRLWYSKATNTWEFWNGSTKKTVDVV